MRRHLPADRLRRSVSSAAAAVAVLSLAACTSAVDTAGSTAAEGGKLTFATALDAQPQNMLMNLARNDPWSRNVFEPLVDLARDTGEPKPLLATDWTVSPDGLSVTVNLRGDITFHKGDALTAADVKFTVDKVMSPDTPTNIRYAKVTKTEVTSPTQVVLTLAEPAGPALFDFLGSLPIVNDATFTEKGNGTDIDGTGPFAFTSWNPGASYTLKRNAKYWGAKPHLDEIEFVVTKDATAELSALRSGRAQAAWGLNAADVQSLAADPKWTVVDSGGTIYSLNLNVTKAPFTDKAVRQAVGYAIDYDRINQQVFGGIGVKSNVYWAPDDPGMTEQLNRRYTYDPAKAKALVEQAGAAGAEVPIVYGPNPALAAEYEIIANNLTAIGLKPKAVPADNGQFGAGLEAGDLGPAFLHLNGQVGLSPATMLDSIPALRQKNANGFWNDEYVTKRTALQQADSDGARGPALAGLTEHLLDQAFTFPIVQAPIQVVVGQSVQGVTASVRGPLLFANAALTQ
ncbi:ABC transporter substrate-binding protein [Streptosporangium canum]|uniref:ABC transporter substrate-binding protein n=1 Tax=Streptosporangium canum TaxID=324952 RepID=UPI00368D30AD